VLYNRVKKTAIELSPCTHGARIGESAEISGKGADELIDFSVNLNPLGTPKLRKLLFKACESMNYYPDNRYPGFKKPLRIVLMYRLKISFPEMAPQN
jgi:threonine-phosphate decarboxylase